MRAVLLLALALAVALSAAPPTQTHAQTRSPTRRPTTPTTTPATTPLCAVYGQLPQVLNATGAANGLAGFNVALSADATVLAVAAPKDGTGTVSVYTRPTASPTATPYTRSAVIAPPASFGVETANFVSVATMAMAATGDTIAVATRQIGNGDNGSVVVFRATTRGFLTFNASILLEQDLGMGDESGFGSSISISKQGNLIAVGALDAFDSSVSDSVGAVAVYRRGGAGVQSWEFAREATIVPNPVVVGMKFGRAVAITDTNVLAVGAGLGSGLVYTFARAVDGVWAQQGPALLPDAANYDAGVFGATVALDTAGVVLAVGDPADATRASNGGAVWFTARATRASVWAPLQVVLPPVPQAEANFGLSLVMSAAGTTVVVGAPAFSSAPGSGPAWYRLDRNALGVWSFAPSGAGYASPGSFASTRTLDIPSTLLGASVDVSADASFVVVGSPQRVNAAGVEIGAAEVWTCGVTP